jgi:hypothetical protein
MKTPLWIARLGLLFLMFNALLVGLWALLLPASFYSSFPGGGWVWVSLDGPYNEHLVRDVGGLNLAVAVLALMAFLEPTPSLLRVSALVTLAFQLPHNVYHLIHVGMLPGSLQQVVQTLGLFLGILVSLAVWAGSRGRGIGRPA